MTRVADVSRAQQLGRFVEPALWAMLALRDGPQPLTGLFDGARSLDGPIGHGTLLGALVRLEHLGLVERTVTGDGPTYRLTSRGTAASAVARLLT